MNELSPLPDNGVLVHEHPVDHQSVQTPVQSKGRAGRTLLAFLVITLLVGALGYGFWKHYTVHAEVMATANARRDFVPAVRAAAVRASEPFRIASWPGTTEAFEQANIYARASGYISKRNVDIGSRVKAGDLLVEITAPEIEHQIAQAEGTLTQLRANLEQAKANRDLAQVTWDRDSKLLKQGWTTAQQGDTDRLTLQSREAAVSVAAANIVAQEAQLRVLNQQRVYQRVVAPFDGVITQRNIDVGSLVQADAASGTFLFALAHADVIRIQLYVPQDEAFGLKPGIEAEVHVPEIPDRAFPGKVTRIADAIQPGSRTLLTEIDIPNPDGALTPGIYCTIELHIPRKTPSFKVSADAVIFNQGGLQVAVVENGVVHLRKIGVVRDLGREVLVNSGVKQGDQVILNPVVDLAEGAKVRTRPQAAVS